MWPDDFINSLGSTEGDLLKRDKDSWQVLYLEVLSDCSVEECRVAPGGGTVMLMRALEA